MNYQILGIQQVNICCKNEYCGGPRLHPFLQLWLSKPSAVMLRLLGKGQFKKLPTIYVFKVQYMKEGI